jgi:hypothetical protein
MDELDHGTALVLICPTSARAAWMEIQAPTGLQEVPTAADLGAGEKGSVGVRNADSSFRGNSERTTWDSLMPWH